MEQFFLCAVAAIAVYASLHSIIMSIDDFLEDHNGADQR